MLLGNFTNQRSHLSLFRGQGVEMKQKQYTNESELTAGKWVVFYEPVSVEVTDNIEVITYEAE